MTGFHILFYSAPAKHFSLKRFGFRAEDPGDPFSGLEAVGYISSAVLQEVVLQEVGRACCWQMHCLPDIDHFQHLKMQNFHKGEHTSE
jgi:hypothetical protein